MPCRDLCYGHQITASISARTDPTITCTSTGGQYTECAVPGGGDIILTQQLSKAACIKNQTWGETGDGVYVKDGCRAIFESN